MIAGIDLSSHAVDCVLVDEDDPSVVAWWRWQLPGPGAAFERTRRVRDAMPPRSWWRDEGVTLVGMESPAGASFSAVPLLRVQGAILACIPADLPLVPIMPMEWRKEIGLKGNATKEQTRSWAIQIIGPDARPWPHDATDAYGIARAAPTIYERGNE